MKFFDGLYSYEVVLLVLGILLFLVLLVAFVVLLVQGKSLGKLSVFFVIAIVMIGFPSVKSIQYSKGVLTIENETHDLQQDPTNNTVRQQLKNQLASLAPRPTKDALVVTTFASAQIALGQNEEAQASVNKALQLAPQYPRVVALQQRLELDRKLADLAAKVEQDPNNIVTKIELQSTVTQLSNQPIANPVTIANLARAQAVIGNQAQAQSNLEKVRRINPDLVPAMQLRNRIGNQ